MASDQHRAGTSASVPRAARSGWRDPMLVAGGFLGASIPALSFGNGALGACFGIACLIALFASDRRDLARRAGGLLAGAAGLCAALTLVWWTLSAGASLSPLDSLEVIARMVIFVGLGGWLILALAARPDARRVAESVVVIGGAVSMGAAAIGSYIAPDLLWIFEPLTDEEIDPRHVFKSFAAAVAVVSPVLILIGWRRGGAWLGLAAFALVTGGLLLWGHGVQPARASIVGAVGGLFLVAFTMIAGRLTARARVAMVLLVSLGLVFVMAWIVNALPIMPFGSETQHAPPLPLLDFHRQAIWGFVSHLIGEAPLLGHGINTINMAPGAAVIVPGLNQQFVPGHPHNWILEIASETGVPGFIFFATTQALLVMAFASIALGGAPRVRGAGFAGIAVLGVFWTASLANFSIWSAWWQITLIAALAIPASASLEASMAREAKGTRGDL